MVLCVCSPYSSMLLLLSGTGERGGSSRSSTCSDVSLLSLEGGGVFSAAFFLSCSCSADVLAPSPRSSSLRKRQQTFHMESYLKPLKKLNKYKTRQFYICKATVILSFNTEANLWVSIRAFILKAISVGSLYLTLWLRRSHLSCSNATLVSRCSLSSLALLLSSLARSNSSLSLSSFSLASLLSSLALLMSSLAWAVSSLILSSSSLSRSLSWISRGKAWRRKKGKLADRKASE